MGVLPIIAMCALAIGLALALIGWRGRRIDDHPVCRKCKFDLDGVFPAIRTCPECGRDLSNARSVGTGNRRPRWIFLIPGGTLLAVVLMTGGLIITLFFAGSSLNKHKPAWILLLEARWTDAARASDAIDELVARYEGNDLSGGQIDRFVTLALDERADENDPNLLQWIDTIEMLIGAGELSDDEFARYIQDRVVLSTRVRSRVQVGEDIPFVIGLGDIRVARRNFVVEVHVDKIRLGDVPIADTIQLRLPMRGRLSATTMAGISVSRLAGSMESGVGVHDLSADLTARIRWLDRRAPGDAPVVVTIHRHIRHRIEVVDEPVPRAVRPNRKLREAMRSAFSKADIVVSEGHDAQEWIVSLNGVLAPMAVAFRCFYRLAGAGDLLGGDSFVRFIPGKPQSVTYVIRAPVDLGEASTIDIILRPDSELVFDLIDLSEIYGEDIVLEGTLIIRPAG